MSPSTVTAPARRRSRRGPGVARRRAAARRRRIALGLFVVAVVIAGIVFVMPLAQRAVNDLGLPLSYSGAIRQQAAKERLDPALVAAVIYAESKFDPRTSSAGAVGLMQLLPETATYLARRSGATTFRTSDLSTPEVNIAYGSYYLRYLFDEFHGNTVLALAAYNGGDANVHSWIATDHAQGRSFQIGDIPFPETRAYVQRVLQARAEYRRKYASQLGYG